MSRKTKVQNRIQMTIHREISSIKALLAALYTFFLFCGEQYRRYGTIFGTLARKPGIIPDTEKERVLPWLEQQYIRFCSWFDAQSPYGKWLRYLMIWLLLLLLITALAALADRLIPTSGTSTGE